MLSKHRPPGILQMHRVVPWLLGLGGSIPFGVFFPSMAKDLYFRVLGLGFRASFDSHTRTSRHSRYRSKLGPV